jgi:hypothetical protein
MSDALFDDDPDEAKGPPSNVLAVGRVAESSEAMTATATAMRRHPDYQRAAMVIFIDEGDVFGNAAQFRAAMGWPRDPTIAEASAWLTGMRDRVSGKG